MIKVLKTIKITTFVLALLMASLKLEAYKKDDVSAKNKIAACQCAVTKKRKAKYELEQIDQNRKKSYNIVANKLACLSDQQISKLVSNDKEWSSGYGKTASIDIDGVKVFVKKIPLTDLEEQPKNIRSTANLFDLPLFYQYGVGSAGFGAWRELAALIMASNWVVTDACKNFPLLYHWRVMHNDVVPGVKSESKLDKKVKYWNNSSAVRNRIESMNQATSSVVVFSENFPQTLNAYLEEKIQEGAYQFDAAVKMVDYDLQQTASFMIDHGMIHFDAHGHNIMTDGNRLYFADFGLAISSLFDLSEEEKSFFVEHKNYDKIYVQGALVFDIFETLKFDDKEALGQLQKYKDGDKTIVHSTYITSVLQKYACSALLVDEFMANLRKKSKLTPYPTQEIENVLAAVGKYKNKKD